MSAGLDGATIRAAVATLRAPGAPAFDVVPADWPWDWILGSCVAHLWDNVALFVAVALLEYWGVTAPPWDNDEDHTLGWLADAP